MTNTYTESELSKDKLVRILKRIGIITEYQRRVMFVAPCVYIHKMVYNAKKNN